MSHDLARSSISARSRTGSVTKPYDAAHRMLNNLLVEVRRDCLFLDRRNHDRQSQQYLWDSRVETAAVLSFLLIVRCARQAPRSDGAPGLRM